MADELKYSCYDAEYENQIEGAIVGTKEEVLAWMREKYGKVEESKMMSAALFFSQRDCTEYLTQEGAQLVLGEVRDETEEED